jgi:hypothetical protein
MFRKFTGFELDCHNSIPVEALGLSFRHTEKGSGFIDIVTGGYQRLAYAGTKATGK